MNAKSFCLSLQGASHIKKNKECQDASMSYSDEHIAIAIVCDGHGGADYIRSAIGSLCACNAAEINIKNFLENTNKDVFFTNPEKSLHMLEASIINVWNQLIYAHYEKNPFLPMELEGISEKAKKKYVEDRRIESAYGTTLIAVGMTHDYWFGIHIGDGKCVAINPEGKFVQPIPWDSKCFLNATTSICDSDALSNFRHFYSQKLPVAVFVGSDGVDDCFSNNEQLYNLYRTILYSFGTSEFKEALDGLKDYLPRLSAKGSGDDVSIAAILDFDLLSDLEVVKKFDREKEKARVEENARKEVERNEAEKRRIEQEHACFQREANSHREILQKPKFCTKCGARILEEYKFCSGCGSKITFVSETLELEHGNKQISTFSFKETQTENVVESALQQEMNTELNEQIKTDTKVEVNCIQVTEDTIDKVNNEQQKEAMERKLDDIEVDSSFRENAKEVLLLNKEEIIIEECLENKSMDEVIETQKDI